MNLDSSEYTSFREKIQHQTRYNLQGLKVSINPTRSDWSFHQRNKERVFMEVEKENINFKKRKRLK